MQMFPLSNLYNTLCLFQKYILAHFSDTRIIVANFSHPLPAWLWNLEGSSIIVLFTLILAKI